MIIKGNSRGRPTQLARHLTRLDTNERMEILSSDYGDDLKAALQDMQTTAAATKGRKGLYHANVSPDAKYPTLSSEQWMHAADVLADELGLSGQPRVVILHQKDGRGHIHVVWQRANLETMTLVSDSQNYAAHERASRRLELELGHELTPGVHAKRDPDRPRPRAKMSHAEWQQYERTKLDPAERKATLTEIYRASENGKAFAAAIQEKGYALAQGDRRALVVVDPAGDIHSLSRQIEGAKAKEIKEKLSDLDPAQLRKASDLAEEIKSREPENRPAPAFNKAGAHERIDPEEQARLEIHQKRQDLIEELRKERQSRQKEWAKTVQGEREALGRHLEERRADDAKAEQDARVPKSFGERVLALWSELQDKLDPSRVQTREREAEEKRSAREQRDREAIEARARELEDWKAQQLKTLQDNHAARRRAFEEGRTAEVARLKREAERYQALQREKLEITQARQREGPGIDR
jgi:hypothetical protein